MHVTKTDATIKAEAATIEARQRHSKVNSDEAISAYFDEKAMKAARRGGWQESATGNWFRPVRVGDKGGVVIDGVIWAAHAREACKIDDENE